ncbi:MAG: ABC transporter permease, partial [Rhizobiales bacterium]|nr:ABC transporter permease [Hyphomicrobiales bacterium]
MIRFIFKRSILAFFVAITVSIISFSLLFLAGDPSIALAGEGATEADIEAIKIQYGFDRSVFEQYITWLGNAFVGDFGESYYFKTPVFDLIAEKMPITMGLGLAAISFATIISIPLGVLAAVKPNSLIDRCA